MLPHETPVWRRHPVLLIPDHIIVASRSLPSLAPTFAWSPEAEELTVDVGIVVSLAPPEGDPERQPPWTPGMTPGAAVAAALQAGFTASDTTPPFDARVLVLVSNLDLERVRRVGPERERLDVRSWDGLSAPSIE